MCLVWTVKYNICGCICERESIYCSEYQYCWGARVVIFQANLQTCKDCWSKGDKRVNESRNLHSSDEPESEKHEGNIVPMIRTERNRRGYGFRISRGIGEDAESATEQIMRTTNKHGCELPGSQHRGHNEDGRCSSPNPASRPNTPVRSLALDLDPDYRPQWLLSIEQNCDLTRVCDPVKTPSIPNGRRAPRTRTDWYSLEGKSLNILLFSSRIGSECYLDRSCRCVGSISRAQRGTGS